MHNEFVYRKGVLDLQQKHFRSLRHRAYEQSNFCYIEFLALIYKNFLCTVFSSLCSFYSIPENTLDWNLDTHDCIDEHVSCSSFSNYWTSCDCTLDNGNSVQFDLLYEHRTQLQSWFDRTWYKQHHRLENTYKRSKGVDCNKSADTPCNENYSRLFGGYPYKTKIHLLFDYIWNTVFLWFPPKDTQVLDVLYQKSWRLSNADAAE